MAGLHTTVDAAYADLDREATEVVLVDPDTGDRLILRLGHAQHGPTLMVELPNGEQHDLIYPEMRVLPLRH